MPGMRKFTALVLNLVFCLVFLWFQLGDAYADKYPSEAKSVCSAEAHQMGAIWAPDGKKYAYTEMIYDKYLAIKVCDIEERKLIPLFQMKKEKGKIISIIEELEGIRIEHKEPTILEFVWGSDSRHFAFILSSQEVDKNGIYIGELGREPHLIWNDLKVTGLAWSANDENRNSYLAFISGATLYAQKMNRDYRPEGERVMILSAPDSYLSYPVFSPDGKALVFSMDDKRKGPKLFRCSSKSWIEGSKCEAEQLTKDDRWSTDYSPAFSPDGRFIAFYSTREREESLAGQNVYTLWVIDLKSKKNGRYQIKKATPDYIRKSDLFYIRPSWLDKGTLIYIKYAAMDPYPIYKVEIRAEGSSLYSTKPEVVKPFDNPAHEGLKKHISVPDLSVSPHGSSIAFSHQEDFDRGGWYQIAWIQLRKPGKEPKRKEVYGSHIAIEKSFYHVARVTYLEGFTFATPRATKSKQKEFDSLKGGYERSQLFFSDTLSKVLGNKELEKIKYVRYTMEEGAKLLVLRTAKYDGEIRLERKHDTIVIYLDYKYKKGERGGIEDKKGEFKMPDSTKALVEKLKDLTKMRQRQNVSRTYHILNEQKIGVRKVTSSQISLEPGEEEHLIGIVVVNGKEVGKIFPLPSTDAGKVEGIRSDNPKIWRVEITR